MCLADYIYAGWPTKQPTDENDDQLHRNRVDGSQGGPCERRKTKRRPSEDIMVSQVKMYSSKNVGNELRHNYTNFYRLDKHLIWLISQTSDLHRWAYGSIQSEIK